MIPKDQVLFLLGIAGSIPLSFLLRYIENHQMRKYYSMVLGIVLLYFVYGYQLITPLLSHMAIYLLIKNVPRRKCGFYISTVSLIMLSLYHIYRTVYDYGSWTLDVSTVLMNCVCKYSAFAFSYEDGLQKQHKYQQRHQEMIQTLPNFMDFLGYCIFLPTSVINTPLDYVRYDNFIRKKEQFKQIPVQQSLTKMGKEFLYICVFLGMYAIYGLYFTTGKMTQDQFTSNSISYIFFYSFCSTTFGRCKYYFGFKYSQIPIHSSGVSYEPNSKRQDNFLGIQSCNPIQIETTIHVRQKINNWNMTSQQWLRKCIYERLPYSKTTNQVITFAISAFWHGFYGGYYVSFTLWFMQMHLAGLIFKYSQNKNNILVKLYEKTNPYSYYIMFVIWNAMFSHHATYFMILSAESSFKILSATYFLTPICMFVLTIFFTFVRKPHKKTDQSKQ